MVELGHMNKVLTRYAQIEGEITRLEAEKASLKTAVTEAVAKAEKGITTDYGVFQRVVNKVWTYSDFFTKQQEKIDKQIVALREQIKERKLKAQLDKRATFEPQVTFRFIPGGIRVAIPGK